MNTLHIYNEIKLREEQLATMQEQYNKLDDEYLEACSTRDRAECDESVSETEYNRLNEITKEYSIKLGNLDDKMYWIANAINHLKETLEMYEYLEAEGVEL